MRRKRLLHLTLSLLLSCFLANSYGASKAKKDTIEYRAQVWVEKADLARYGGAETFNKKLKEMFHYTTRFWNESENKFDYFFRYIPAGVQVYDIEGDQDRYDEFRKKAYGPLDTQKYDFVVFFALNTKNNGLYCSGGGKSGQAVVVCYQTLEEQQKRGDIFTIDYPKQGMYSNLGHEYGHVRGATDMYQYIIKAEDNPVSHQALHPPKCNMGNGIGAWSDYCSTLFNFTAKQKQLEKDLTQKIFPRTLRIKVLVDGKPVENIPVKFYGTRAGGSKNKRDVYPIPYRSFETNKKGNVDVGEVMKLYHPTKGEPNLPPADAFPYAYWFCFLVEAEHNGMKKYAWVPDWATQISKMQGKNIHEAVISF